MPPTLRQRWNCRLCGLEVWTSGPMPSIRYDDGCRAVVRGDRCFGAHDWDEATVLIQERRIIEIDVAATA